MKIAYIAHPIGGNVKANLAKVRKIARHINMNEPDTLPFAPYYLDCVCLDDSDPGERSRGIKNDTYLLESGLVDELRLYGDRISNGMYDEILIALRENIPIIPMTPETKKEFNQ